MQSYKITVRGKPAEVKYLDVKALDRLEPHKACAIFPALDEEALERLTISVQRGFDESQPIIAWKKTGQIVDGLQRRRAALDCNTEAPVAYVDFANENEVIDFVVGANLGRRHLNATQKKEMRRQLLEMGKSVKEIAKALGETQSSVSHALKPELAKKKAQQRAVVAEEINKGGTVEKAAAKAGVSKSTADRIAKSAAKAPAAKPAAKPLTGGKAVPAGPAAPKYDPKCNDVFKTAGLAGAFMTAATRASNPVPLEAQLPLARECLKALSETERGSKAAGSIAIAKWMDFQYPLGGNGRRVEAPAPKPAPAPATMAENAKAAGKQMQPLPLPPVAPADLDMTALRVDVTGLSAKTIEQALNILIDIRDEVKSDNFGKAMQALFVTVESSFKAHPVMVRNKRVPDMIAALTPEKKENGK